MGLFGGYSEKDYKVSTDEFVSRIQDLHIDVGGQMGIGKVLMKLVATLQKDGYPKRANHKDVKAIDERIAKLVDSMERDAQEQNIPKLSAHADMLFEAVTLSRKYGTERHDAAYLKNQEAKVTALGTIHNLLTRKTQIEEAKKDIEEKAKNASGAEFETLEIDYATLEEEEATLQIQVNTWRTKYNAAVKIENEKKVGSTIKELDENELQDAASFQQEVETNNAMLEMKLETYNTISETATEAQSSRKGLAGAGVGTSNLAANVEARKAAEAAGIIGDANNSGAAQSTQRSSLASKLGRG